MALVYLQLGEVDKAEALLERATQQNPEISKVNLRLKDGF